MPRTREEQNLVAYPANGKLFFCTTTEIHPDQELLFYYSRDYCRLMGEKTDDETCLLILKKCHCHPWLS